MKLQRVDHHFSLFNSAQGPCLLTPLLYPLCVCMRVRVCKLSYHFAEGGKIFSLNQTSGIQALKAAQWAVRSGALDLIDRVAQVSATSRTRLLSHCRLTNHSIHFSTAFHDRWVGDFSKRHALILHNLMI